MQDRIKVNAVQVDLDIDGVDDEDEENIGAFIKLNDDDGDDNGEPDYDDDGDVSEDDLVRIELVDCLPADLDVGSVRLEGIGYVFETQETFTSRKKCERNGLYRGQRPLNITYPKPGECEY